MNTLDLRGRVAVVIGGTSGLGRAIALGLAEAGADVAATGRRADLVETVAGEIEKLGRRSLRFPVDVLSRASLDAFKAAVVEQLGGVDVLVNAAGRISKAAVKDVQRGGVGFGAEHQRHRRSAGLPGVL